MDVIRFCIILQVFGSALTDYSVSPTLNGVSDPTDPTLNGVSDTTDPTQSDVSDTTDPTLSGVSDTTDPTLNGVSDPTDPTQSDVSDTTDPTESDVSDPNDPTLSGVSDTTDPTLNGVSDPTDPTQSDVSDTTDPTESDVSDPTDPTQSDVSDTTDQTHLSVSVTTEAYDFWTVWTSWCACYPVPGSIDQSCDGVRHRTRTLYTGGTLNRTDIDEESCKLTIDVIDGGLSEWTDWNDCSMNCNGTSHRYRVCNSPLPCNGGLTCTGSTQETMDCGPVDGDWTEWGNWSDCQAISASNNTTKQYGKGTSVRWRYCSDPFPICGGVCHGEENETIQCTVIPECLTENIFDSSNVDPSSPMVVYSSAKIRIVTHIQNLCIKNTTIYYNWHLYLYNDSMDDNVTEHDMGRHSERYFFLLTPHDLQPGIYRLYVKIGYPRNFTHWMEESMFIKVEHPPPNTFIMGGTGRITGAGLVQFDGRTQSYSLKNSPGDPSGLVFDWECLQLVTSDIYDLLNFYIDPTFVFVEHASQLSWYDIEFVDTVYDLVELANASLLIDLVKILPNSGTLAKSLNVTISQNYYTNVTNGTVDNSTVYTTYMDSNFTNFVYQINETVPLKDFFSIKYMSDMVKTRNKKPKLSTTVILPDNNQQMKTDLLGILNTIFDGNETFLLQLKDFRDLLSDSYEIVSSINNLQRLPNVYMTNSFHNDMNNWLDKVDEIKIYLHKLNEVLYLFKVEMPNIEAGLTLLDYIETGSFLRLIIDESPPSTEKYLLQLLDTLYDVIFRLIDCDWDWIEDKEKLFIDWLVNDLIPQLKCRNFTGMEDGFANLTVTDQNVLDSHGYLVYLRADNEGSLGYFIQHTQTIPGIPPELELECRLNCMKKTATTSLMSLVAVCKSCSISDLKHATFSWNFKQFNFITRTTENYTGWQDMILTDLDSSKFVMKSGLPENHGFIIEATIRLLSGQTTKSIWLITTDFLPHGGRCTVDRSKDFPDQYEVFARNWKDEGFRSRRDSRIDWKEQLNYRIGQVTQEGASFLYYGYDELSTIKIKPGLPEDEYKVTLEIQIYDIFMDYATCYVSINNVRPPVQNTESPTDLQDYIQKSNDDIEYHYKTGNFKLVAMNTEVVGATVAGIEISQPGLEHDPSNWTQLGTRTLDNGTVQHFTFDEIWDSFQNASHRESIELIQQTMNGYTSTLDNVSVATDVESLVNIRQLCTSIGTVIDKKQYVVRSAASIALEGNKKMVDKFISLAENDTYPKYEDYIFASQDVLRVLSNALDGVSPELSADIPPDINVYTMRDHLALLDEFESDKNTSTTVNDTVDLTDTEKTYIATQMALKSDYDQKGFQEEAQKATQAIFDTVKSLGVVLERLNYRKKLPIYVRNKGMSTSIDVKPVGDLLNKGLEQDTVRLEFNANDITQVQDQKIQLTVFDKTPFSWDSTESKFITSGTVRAEIGDSGVSTLPSKIRFTNKLAPTAGKTFQMVVPEDAEEGFIYHVFYKMYWRTPKDSLIVLIDRADTSLRYQISLKQNKQPTDIDFDYKRDIQDLDWKDSGSISFIVDGGLYDEPSKVYVRIQMSRSHIANLTMDYVHTTRSAIKDPGTYEYETGKTRRRRSAFASNMTLIDTTISTATTGCRVWNNVSQTWDSKACYLSPNSTIYETICLCTKPPGNSFATTFYVPPNMIDFGSVFSKFDISNSAVLFTVVGVILLFILFCVYAVKRDRGDPQRWAVSYLADNSMGDEYLYMVTVVTGLRKNAGTKSNVAFVITYDDTTTSVRHLEDGKHLGFEHGSIRKFVMSVPEKIDNPSFMSVWHDNSGQGSDASWYLSKIVLDDIQTSEQHLFIFEEWLSVDEPGGKLQTISHAVNDKDQKQFSFLFNDQARSVTTDNHLWFSVYIRPEPSSFSRLKRLSCCLVLLFLSMITNAMFYGQDSQSHQASFGPITFSLAGVYISIISIVITIPPLFLITFLFKNTRSFRANKDKSNIEHLILNPQKDLLPVGYQILAWSLVVLSVASSGFFVILYSMEWGKDKSEEWLLSFFLSFMESIFIVDPVKIIIITSVFAYMSTNVENKRTTRVRYNRELILKETNQRANSPLNILLDTFRENCAMPLDNSTINELKERRQQMIKAEQVLIEFLVYLFFLFTLYTVSFSNRDVKWYTSNLHIKQHLVNQQRNRTHIISESTMFEAIKSSDDFYSWLNKTLIPFVFPMDSVMEGKLSAYNRQFTLDLTNYRVGPIRLRQVRSNYGDCLPEISHDYITCTNKYSVLEEEEASFCVAWETMPCPKTQAIYNITSDAWTFKSALDLWGLPTTGYHTTYGGGGYVADLGVNNAISRQTINDLYKYIWIDRQTRAIFTEFTLYNANENLFLYVSFLCEFPEFGSVLVTPSVQPFRPYQHVGSFGVIVFVCEIVVLIAVVIISVKMIYDVCKQGKAYFASHRSVFDLIIVIIFFVCFVMYIGRCVMISNSMNAFKDNKHKFVNFGHIATWDEMLNVVLSFLIFFTTVRLMRVLSYNSRITQLSSVLSHVSNDLLGCFVLFFIVYMAFVCFGYLVFGRQLHEYRNMLVSVTTITNAVVGRNSINNLFFCDPVLGRIYYFLFVLFVVWILVTMLCATLNIGINEVRTSSKAISTPYGIVDLTERYINNLVNWFKPSDNVKKPSTNTVFKAFGVRHWRMSQARYKCD